MKLAPGGSQAGFAGRALLFRRFCAPVEHKTKCRRGTCSEFELRGQIVEDGFQLLQEVIGRYMAEAVRDKSGRFVKGHAPTSAGRPRSRNTDYAKLIRTALTEQAAYRIIEKAIEDAKSGEPRSREWLFKHVVAPIPKTLVVSDATSETRENLDETLTRMMSPEQILALDAILAKREKTDEG